MVAWKGLIRLVITERITSHSTLVRSAVFPIISSQATTEIDHF